MAKKTGRIALLVAALACGSANLAEAGLIDYTYTTSLSLASGTDSAGLAGAKIVVDAQFDTSSVYVTRFGFPAVLANGGASYTVSGSSIAANNGTFALPQLAFYATFAGLFGDPSGVHPVVTLAFGGTLDLHLNTGATSHGISVVAGNTVNILDFAPATSSGIQWEGSNGLYNQVNPTVNATLINSVPEPSSLALCGIAGLVGLGFARSRRKRAG